MKKKFIQNNNNNNNNNSYSEYLLYNIKQKCLKIDNIIIYGHCCESIIVHPYNYIHITTNHHKILANYLYILVEKDCVRIITV